MNSKGMVDQLLIVLVIGVILAIVIMVFWVGSMTLPLIAGSGTQVINQIRTTTNSQEPGGSLDNATQTATSIASGVIGIGESLVYVVFFIMIIGFFTMAYYVRTYPFLAFFWIFIMIALTFLSMIVTNSYLTASQQSATASFYASWGSNDFIMSNLPIIMVVVGTIGGIFLFILASKDPEAETQQL